MSNGSTSCETSTSVASDAAPRITAFMAATYGELVPKSVVRVMIGISECRFPPDESGRLRVAGAPEAARRVTQVRLDGGPLQAIGGVTQDAGRPAGADLLSVGHGLL